MKQDVGETCDAVFSDAKELVKNLISKNSHVKDLYWIVVFAKPSHHKFDGKPTMIQHIKAYFKKRPSSQVGMIIGVVDNSKGSVVWEVNQPQRPFDFDALGVFGCSPSNEVIVETASIPWAYVTQ